MADDTQAVVNPTEAQPAQVEAEAPDARNDEGDLSKWLSEYKNAPDAPDASQQPSEQSTPASPMEARLTELENQLATKELDAEVRPVIETIRGDITPDQLSDSEIRDLLEGRAARDPALRRAWTDRRNNPETWGKIVNALGREMATKFAKVHDVNATEDREAVTAAVRGASSKAPEGAEPDYSGLNDQEFAAQVEKQHGFRPF